ncbi:hypothetical protein Efla_005828 [Eimeria flavescens]
MTVGDTEGGTSGLYRHPEEDFSRISSFSDDSDGEAFVQEGKDRFVGLLEHEQLMAYSGSLQRIFEKSGKFTHSFQFLKELFSGNPLLKYFALGYKDRTKLVDRLERSAKSWVPLLKKDKAVAAEKLLAEVALRHLFTRRESLLSRQAYRARVAEVRAALRQVNAGGHAMDLILGAKTKPLFTFTDSFMKNPLATVTHAVTAAFHETFDPEGGIVGLEVKKSCYSVGYRVNTIVPYTSVFPGGIFGSIMKSLARSFMFVFYPAYASMRGIFTLMIAVICKSKLVKAAQKIAESIENMVRLGLRGVRILMRRFSVRNDPVGWPLIRDLLRSGSAKLTTILFQLYAVDVEDITKRGKSVSNALAAGSAAWNFADGLWVGAADFGGAFLGIVRQYQQRVKALSLYCEYQVSDFSQAPRLCSSAGLLVCCDSSLLKWSSFAPWRPITRIVGCLLFCSQCRIHKGFLQSYKKDPAPHVQKLVGQIIKVLKYDYKYFKRYVGEMLAIFYETAYVVLNADVANVLKEKLSADTLGDQISTAMARQQLYHEASADLHKSILARKFFREPWFRQSGEKLAHGFFHTAGGLAIYYALDGGDVQGAKSRRLKAAFQHLSKGASSLRKSVKSIFGRFLESKIMISRLEGHPSVRTVQQFLAKCNERHGAPDPEVCGKVVTGELDPEAFVLEAIYAMNLRMAAPPTDIALLDNVDYGRVFTAWLESSKISKRNRNIALKASDTGVQQPMQSTPTVRQKLSFPRFDFADDFTTLILYDLNGRSLIFIRKPYFYFCIGRATGRGSPFRPSPLQSACWFRVDRENVGTLQFPLAEGSRGAEQITASSGPSAPVSGLPVYEVQGRINYRDTREELASITNDPTAVRDVIVARFLLSQGRASAELMANLLFLLHSKSRSFQKHSPSVFLQNMLPKMFFDAFHALDVASKTKSATGVSVEGRLYTFPFNFNTMKSLVLSAVNRLILRMHSLQSKDIVSIFMLTVAVMAYHKIQKHRTGKTLVMNLYLRDALHLYRVHRKGSLDEEVPYCSWIRETSGSIDEFIVKCSCYRFLKLGDLNDTESNRQKLSDYVSTFYVILNDVRGQTSWWDFLNVRVFYPEAPLYEETAAKYSYGELEQQIKAEQDMLGEESLASLLHSDIHPVLGGPRSYVKDQKDLVTALRSYAEDIKKLPKSLRSRLGRFVKGVYGKLRRFIGAKQFTWFTTIRPNVLHATTFFAAIQQAETLIFPNPNLPRGIFIDLLDLTEYAKLQLSFEELAVTLSHAQAMQHIVSEIRTMPLQTEEAREEYRKLKAKVEGLPVEVVEAAAGWALRFLGEGQGGMEQALGLLALKSSDPEQLSKALHLTLASVEVLGFLNTSLDVAQVLTFLPDASGEDLRRLRIRLQSFGATLQTEARSIGLNIKTAFPLAQTVENLKHALELLGVEACESVLTDMPPAFVRGSLDSGNMTEPAGLCYFFLELVQKLSQRKETFIPSELFEKTAVDGTTVNKYLKQILNTSLSAEVRLGAIKKLSPLLRSLLIACMGHQIGAIGAAQFTAVDMKTGVLTFVFAGVVELSTEGREALHPAEMFRRVARLTFGTEGLEGQPEGTRVVAAHVSYSPSLEDWCSYIDRVKLEELTARVQSGSAQLTGEALAGVSAAIRMADITDYFFSLRHASPLDPRETLRVAKRLVMEDSNLSPLERIGMAVMVSDLLKLAQQAKVNCLQKAMDNIEIYLPFTLLERHLYQYDCFVNKLSDGMALTSVARTSSNEFVERALHKIESALALKAEELFGRLKSNATAAESVAERAAAYLKQAPNLTFAFPVVRQVAMSVSGSDGWTQLLAKLQAMKEMNWTIKQPTPARKRHLDWITRPRLFNPMQLAADCLTFIITGVYERPRVPKMLLLSRIKARARMLWKHVGRGAYEDTARDAAANSLLTELSVGQRPPSPMEGENESTSAESLEEGMASRGEYEERGLLAELEGRKSPGPMVEKTEAAEPIEEGKGLPEEPDSEAETTASSSGTPREESSGEEYGSGSPTPVSNDEEADEALADESADREM